MSDVDEKGQLSALHKALFALRKMRTELDRHERAAREPIAVIGMSCRFPGGANNPEQFWQLLREGFDAVTEIPKDRFDVEPYYNENFEIAGSISSRCGAFLDQPVDLFDPGFFGISPREAASLDPQQRILLEVSWEALETAALSPDDLQGSPVGVFVGMMNDDYREVRRENFTHLDDDAYLGSGIGPCFAAGRLSYVLGVSGPSMVIETACSSSLVSLHLACTSLRARECGVALAGGVNLMLSPINFAAISRMGALSCDGRCKTFDASADGFGRGEGCGMIVLKRLEDARRDGDNILALIRGTAVNHDGLSSGLTVPNPSSQREVIRAALEQAGVDPARVGLLEAHGTGTLLGDPLEVKSLREIFGNDRERKFPLFLSSVKTNIGHLEGASGIAGVIKVILAMRHAEIPPHLHLRRINPHISFDGFQVEIPQSLTTWEAESGTRIAGVSSFGMSGTNAHVILGEAPPGEAMPAGIDRPVHLLALSAPDPSAFRALAERYEALLSSGQDDDLADICYSTNSGRKQYPFRRALVGRSRQEIAGKLSESRTSSREISRAARTLRIGYLFPGLGNLSAGVTEELYRTQPLFHEALDECETAIGDRLEVPLLEVLFGGDPRSDALLENPAYGLPVLFVVEYALARMWRAWGVEPFAIMGLGAGEFAAACTAGALDVEEALTLVLATVSHTSQDGPEETISTTAARAPAIPLISGITGEPLERELLLQPGYRRSLMREQARLTAGISAMEDLGCTLFLEIGPGEEPAGNETDHFPDSPRSQVLLPSLHPGRSDWNRVLETLSVLYERGVKVNWKAFDQGYARRKRVLPTYPFQRQRYWYSDDPHPSRSMEALKRTRAAGHEAHELLGRRISSPALADVLFENQVNEFRPGASRDHRINGLNLFPATAFIELIHTAAVDELGFKDVLIADMNFTEPLVIDNGEVRTLQVILKEAEERCPVQIFSAGKGRPKGSGAWTLHVEASLSNQHSVAPEESAFFSRERALSGKREVTGETLYRNMADRGFRFDGAYANLERCWIGDGEAVAIISGADADAHAIAPTFMAGFQTLVATLSGSDDEAPDGHGYLPAGIEAVRFHGGNGDIRWVRAMIKERDDGRAVGDVCFYNEGGEIRAEMSRINLVRVDLDALGSHTQKGWTEDLYALEWVPLADPNSVNGGAVLKSGEGADLYGAHWLIFRDEGEWGRELIGHLEKAGASLTVVQAGEAFSVEEKGIYIVNPAHREDFEQLARALACRLDGQPLRIVHLWNLDCIAPFRDDAELEAFQTLGCESILNIACTFLSRERFPDLEQWVLSRGCQPFKIDPSAIAFPQAMAWGMMRGLSLEYPGTGGGVVDLDPGADRAAEVDQFLEIVGMRTDEDEFMVRDGRWYVSRLVQRSPDGNAVGDIEFDGEAVYLITGGTGHVGWKLAGWMARQGAKHLVLTSRRGGTDGELSEPEDPEGGPFPEESFDEIRGLGCRVEVLRADVTDRERMAGLIASISKSGRRLGGVVHAAADIHGKPMDRMTLEELRAMFNPKVLGTWVLHELTREMDLDIFVTFSSVIAQIGSFGLAHYGAANQFMDAFAHYRRGLGLPSLSINWGTWEGTVMSVDGREHQYQKYGFREIPYEQAFRALGYLISKEEAQFTVADIDWDILKPVYESKGVRMILAGIALQRTAGGGRTLEALKSTPPDSRWNLLMDFVKAEVRSAMGYDKTHRLDPHKGFQELGMDSLMGLEFKKRLESELILTLQSTLIFSTPDIQGLVTHLATEALELDIPVPTSQGGMGIPGKLEEDRLEKEIDGLSEFDLESSLEKELERRGY